MRVESNYLPFSVKNTGCVNEAISLGDAIC